jgi:cytoskeletal protein CcmA (bactofilin family)
MTNDLKIFNLEKMMAENQQQGCLIVGEGVVLKGNFEVPEIASISGTVEGELTAKQIVIEHSGVVRGKVTGESVDVRGEIAEYLSSTRSLIIRSTGKVSGAIHYAELEIEKGGLLHGDLSILAQTPNTAAGDIANQAPVRGVQ